MKGPCPMEGNQVLNATSISSLSLQGSETHHKLHAPFPNQNYLSDHSIKLLP